MGSIGMTTLRRLANIINEAVDNMESVYSKAEMPLPSLDTPFNPADPAEAVLQDPVVAGAVLNIMAAASQLSATVCSPVVSALNASQAVRTYLHCSLCVLTPGGAVPYFILPTCRVRIKRC
jgi:hypothetical protein